MNHPTVGPTDPGTPASPEDRPNPLAGATPSFPAADVPETFAAPAGYDVLGEIGVGGMGVVYRATDRSLNRPVALKYLQERYANQPASVARFVYEARVTARLQHPGIPPVHAVGELSDGRPFLAMKLIQGRTLNERVRDEGPGAGRWLAVFEAVCQAVAYAHSENVIHRDLKPANVMVGAFGEVQVMDWGLAKDLAVRPSQATEAEAETDPWATGPVDPGSDAPPAGSEPTRAGTVLGTPAFMPPEQAIGAIDRLDRRSDVFGLGAILCFLLTGKPPFVAADGEATRQLAARAKLDDAFARLDACGAESELIALAKRCLSPEQGDRPADGDELAGAVAALRREAEERARLAEMEKARAAVQAAERRKRRRLTLALAATVVLGVLLAGGTWAYQRERQRSRQEQTAQDVNRAIGKAQSLRQRADALKPVTLEDWQQAEALRREAVAAGEQAEAAVAAGEADEATRLALGELMPLLNAEAEIAGRNRDVLQRLLDVRFISNDALDDDEFDRSVKQQGNDGRFVYSAGRAVDGYARAFRHFGIDLEALAPERAADAVRREPLRAELAAGLDAWVRHVEAGPGRKKILDAVNAADADPLRVSVRGAWDKGDVPALRRLAADKGALGLPTSTLMLLSDGLFQGDAVEAAIDVLRRAQLARPGDFWLNNKLGEYLMYAGGTTATPRMEEAARFFTAALVIRPRSLTARVNLADALTYIGSHEEAMATYRLALEQEPGLAYVRNKLASSLALAGKYEAARAESKRAVAMRPKSAFIHEGHGSVLFLTGRYADSADAYSEAIALNPDVAAYHSGLGQALSYLGKHKEAVAAHRVAVGIKPSALTYSYLANALVAIRDAGAALVAARRALELQPGSTTALAALGRALQANGQEAQAVEVLRQAVALNPSDSGLYWRLSVALRAVGQLDDAVVAVNESLRRGPAEGPRRADMLKELGQILAQRKDSAGAIRAYRQALEASPEEPAVWLSLIDLALKEDRLTDAAEASQKAFTLAPDEERIRLKLIDVREKQGRVADAAALCTDRAVAKESVFRRRHAQLLIDHGKAKEALDLLDPLTVDAEVRVDHLAWQLRGKALRKLGHLREAVSAYEQMLARTAVGTAPWAEVCLEYGDALREQVRRDGELLTEAQIREKTSLSHAYRAWGLRAQGKPLAAAAACREALAIDPASARSQQTLAEALLDLHQPAEAMTAIAAALKSDPGDPASLMILCRCLVELEELPRANEAAKKAVEQDNQPKDVVALGLVLLEMGQLKEAREQFVKGKDEGQRVRCDRLLALKAKLPAFAAGKEKPAENDLRELAELCSLLDKPALAAGWFRDAVRAEKLNESDPLWDRAISAAARAACGLDDAKDLTAAQRAGWHAAARAWLRKALTRAHQQVAGGEEVNAAVGALRRWQRSKALACVREGGDLPEAERRPWKSLWEEIDGLRKLAEAKRAGE